MATHPPISVPACVNASDYYCFWQIELDDNTIGWATEADTTDSFMEPLPDIIPSTADAGPDQTLMDSDDDGSELVTLDGSGSSDPDGTIESYVWTEDDVEIATGVSPQVNLSVGVHTITLTVTDDDGATDTDEVVITVNPPTVTDTPTPTDTPVPGGSVLDDFNRSDGGIGANWDWDTSGYSIVSNQLDVSSWPHNASDTLLDDFGGGDVN